LPFSRRLEVKVCGSIVIQHNYRQQLQGTAACKPIGFLRCFSSNIRRRRILYNYYLSLFNFLRRQPLPLLYNCPVNVRSIPNILVFERQIVSRRKFHHTPSNGHRYSFSLAPGALAINVLNVSRSSLATSMETVCDLAPARKYELTTVPLSVFSTTVRFPLSLRSLAKGKYRPPLFLQTKGSTDV
jgi:hypothetical protein